MRRTKDPPDPREAALRDLTYRVSQLSPELYSVYRLLSLFGPASDAELLERARNHGLRTGPRQLAHALVELHTRDLLLFEDQQWRIAPLSI